MSFKTKNYPIGDKLISNTVYILFNWISITFFSVFFWIIVGKMLPPKSYGIIATSIQLFSFLSLIVMLGFGSALNKLIPELLEKKRKDKIQGLIVYSFKWVSISTIVLASLLIIFSPQLSFYLKLNPKIIWIIACLIIIASIGGIFGRIYHGLQNMKKIFLTNTLGQITKMLFAFLLIYFGFGYFGPLIAFTLCYLVISFTRLDRKILSISKKTNIDKKLILSYSIPAFITVIFSLLFSETQYIILTILDNVETTGLFAVAMKISFIIPIIPFVFSSALFPITSLLSTNKNKKIKQSYLVRLIFRYSIFFVLPIVLFLIIFSKYAILLFSSSEYLSATKFLPLLAFGAVALGLGEFFLSSLYAIGKPKLQRNIKIVSTLVYIPLAIPLTIYFSGMGLAISYLVAAIILFSLSLITIKRFLDIKLPLKDIGMIILAVSISSIFLLLCRPYVDNFLVAGLFVLLAGFIYLLVLLKFNFYLEEDLKILDFLADRSPIFKKEIIKLRKFLSNFVKRSYKTG